MSKLHTQCKLGLVGATLLAGTMNSSAEAETIFGNSGLFQDPILSGITGELSSGYDSKYFYRGLWFGDDNVWTGVELSTDVCDAITASANAYYLDVLDNGTAYSETGVGFNLAWDSGVGVFDLGITHYQFFDGFDGNQIGQTDATELSLTYTTDLAYGIEGYAQAVYDLRIHAWYFEAGLSRSFALTNYASLDLSATTGFSLGGYYTSGGIIGGADFDAEDGLTHVLLSAALPIQLLDNVTLTPHISVNISGESRDNANDLLGQDDEELFGGASLSVSF